MLKEFVTLGSKVYRLGSKVKLVPNPLYQGTPKQVCDLNETVYILKIEDRGQDGISFDLITRYGEVLVGFETTELELIVKE